MKQVEGQWKGSSMTGPDKVMDVQQGHYRSSATGITQDLPWIMNDAVNQERSDIWNISEFVLHHENILSIYSVYMKIIIFYSSNEKISFITFMYIYGCCNGWYFFIIKNDSQILCWYILKKGRPYISLQLRCCRTISEWVIRFNRLLEDSRHWGPSTPYKLCNHNQYIGIIIFPHTDNT